MNSFTLFAPSIARLPRGSDLMPALSSMELACKLAVPSARRTMTVFDLRRVVDVVANHCMMEERVDHFSS